MEIDLHGATRRRVLERIVQENQQELTKPDDVPKHVDIAVRRRDEVHALLFGQRLDLLGNARNQ